MQGRRHRQRGQRCRRQHRGNPVALRGAFQHRLGQLLDKQRHPVGALDDLRDDIGGERGIAGQSLHQRLAVAFAEPIERQARDVGAAAPGRLEFGTKGDRQQHRQTPHPVDGQIQQLARGRIDPVGVLEHHQHRPVPRLGFELAEQRLEQLLAFALRAEVEVRGGTRQRQQLAQQRDIVVIPRARREQCPQFAELGFDRVVAGEPGGAFELGDEGIERAVLVVRRAEIAQAGMRLASDVLGKRRRQPRLADARLAGDQHHPSFAALRLLPAADQQLDFLVTPDERRLPRAQCLEPAHHAALAEHPPCRLRLGKAGKLSAARDRRDRTARRSAGGSLRQ